MFVNSSVCHCIDAELEWSVDEAQCKLQHANSNNKRLWSSLIMNHTYKLSENGFSETEITMTAFWNQWEVVVTLCVQFTYSHIHSVCKCVCELRSLDVSMQNWLTIWFQDSGSVVEQLLKLVSKLALNTLWLLWCWLLFAFGTQSRYHY